MTPAAAAASGDGMQFIFDSCLSGCDCEIERRPYHRNCKCALHKPRSRTCLRGAAGSGSSSSGKVAFPIRRSWSEGCLAAYGNGSSSLKSSPASGSSSTVDMKMGRRKTSMDPLLELCVEEDDEATWTANYEMKISFFILQFKFQKEFLVLQNGIDIMGMYDFCWRKAIGIVDGMVKMGRSNLASEKQNGWSDNEFQLSRM